jgi:hypothetical protein
MADRRGRAVADGPLQGHFKSGRTYLPPLLSYPQTALSDWVRDDLADLLWPLVLGAIKEDKAASLIGKVQQLVIDTLGEDAIDADDINFDGRLTSIERVPPLHRPALVTALGESWLCEETTPAELVGVLTLYDPLPGSWLLRDPWLSSRPVIDPDRSATLLARAVIDTINDGHLNALVKTPPFGWLVLRGKVTLPGDIIDLLRDYPSDPSTRSQADAFIRSSFLSFKAAGQQVDRSAERAAWASSFWAQNWRQFPCLPEELLEETTDSDPSTAGVTSSDPEPAFEEIPNDPSAAAPADPAAAFAAVTDLFDAFLRAALDPSQPVDLHRPAKHEVVSGLVSRAARAVAAIVRSPHQWSGEHASSTFRLLVETTIVITWMEMKGGEIHEQYQSYGNGKAKLMRQHYQTLIEDLPQDRPKLIDDWAEHLDRKTGGDWGEQFQAVNLDSTFSGVSVRQMAEEAGLSDLYRHLYQPNSGIAHGEWWALEDYAMQRCANPLHLFHRIPSLDPEFPTTTELPRILINQLAELIDLALRSLFGARG